MRDEKQESEFRIQKKRKTKSGSPPFILAPDFWLLDSVLLHPSSLRPHPLLDVFAARLYHPGLTVYRAGTIVPFPKAMKDGGRSCD